MERDRKIFIINTENMQRKRKTDRHSQERDRYTNKDMVKKKRDRQTDKQEIGWIDR